MRGVRHNPPFAQNLRPLEWEYADKARRYYWGRELRSELERMERIVMVMRGGSNE